MISKVAFVYLLMVFCIFEISCDEKNVTTILPVNPSGQLNSSAENLIGNVFGILGNFLNGSNSNNGIGKLLNGLLRGGAGEEKWNPGNSQEKKTNDPIGALQAILPLLSVSGLSDPTQLLPLALSYLKSADGTLKANGVSDACRNDLNMLYDGLGKFEEWAWMMIDSNFKIPSNLFGLNLKWLGDMEECTSVSVNRYSNTSDTVEQFHGKYCRVIFLTGEAALQQSLVLGSCASNHCSNDDVKILVDSLLGAIIPENFQSQIPMSVVSCVEEKPDLDSETIVVICILGLLGTLVVIGTIYDVIAIQLTSKTSKPPVLLSALPKESPPPYMTFNGMPDEGVANGGYEVTESKKEKYVISSPANDGIVTQPRTLVDKVENDRGQRQPKNLLGKILLSFSVYTNGCKLLGTSQGSGSLGAVHGLRFLSMAWVILGHTYFFGIPYTANMVPFMKKKVNQWTFSGIINASTSVDTFFALSGTLVAYLTLKELKKAGGACKFNWFMFYFHRFWRLTPPYMLILMVGTVLYKYFVYGPMQQEGDSMYMTNCRESWWTNLLYVNNYVKLDKGCMGWTWYLANDMQMYIASPLILLPFYYNAIAGCIMSALFLAGTITATAIIENDIKYPVQVWSPYVQHSDADYNKLLYIPVWTRLGPYVVGLVTGYALYRCKCKFRIPLAINLFCWLMSVGIVCSVVYGPFTKDDSHIFSQAEATAYHTLFRTGWGVAICWIIFACATGHGGWINELLSWSPYVPLGRLTYCAYLLHPLVMGVYYENKRDPIFFTDYGTVYLFLGNLVLSYGAAFVASLLFESPMMGLEKAIFKKK